MPRARDISADAGHYLVLGFDMSIVQWRRRPPQGGQ